MSQIDLSNASEVSQRHLSFVETGRSRPSREMVLHLATALEVPLREQNYLLRLAGFAPRYSERGLDDPELEHIRSVLDRLLAAYKPYPAVVVDRCWDVVLANGAAATLTTRLVAPASAALDGGRLNMLRLFLHPDGIRDHVVNRNDAAAQLVHRLGREASTYPNDARLSALTGEVDSYPDVANLRAATRLPTPDDLVVPVHLRAPGLELRLFTTIATIGAPHDITLEELRLETLLPTDVASEDALRNLAS